MTQENPPGQNADIAASAFRSGFVALLGHPNAGKSTLLNALVGYKLAAVSGLPQTTRDRINGIVSRADMQVVFVDLPGLIDPNDRLNETLRWRVLETLNDVDVVVHLVDVSEEKPVSDDMAAILGDVKRPMIFAANKVDLKTSEFHLASFMGELPGPGPGGYSASLVLSAAQEAGLPELLEAIRPHLIEGPPLYDTDHLTDRTMRFLVSEIVREKVYHYTHQEIPYATAVTIDEFIERKKAKWYIGATIHVERDSQKGIVIGKKGDLLKRISRTARQDCEKLCGSPIFLELFVKVTPNWRKNDARLKEFGYDPPKRRKE
ncbi:MAG: GTPase Era [Sumerlaeia bacterium]